MGHGIIGNMRTHTHPARWRWYSLGEVAQLHPSSVAKWQLPLGRNSAKQGRAGVRRTLVSAIAARKTGRDRYWRADAVDGFRFGLASYSWSQRCSSWTAAVNS
jgi:hypothetical protein